MKRYHSICTFDLDDCMKTLGLEEGGRVQQVVTNSVLRLSDEYIPFKEGGLKDSGQIENDTDIVWGGESAPYANYMWNGIVYEDPVLHCAGFQVADGGWRSRKGVQKIPTNRKLKYHNGKKRCSHWVEKMLQDGGREEIEQEARKAVKR